VSAGAAAWGLRAGWVVGSGVAEQDTGGARRATTIQASEEQIEDRIITMEPPCEIITVFVLAGFPISGI